MSKQSPDVEAIVAELARNKKYRAIGIAEETIRDIVLSELARQPNAKAAVQSARKKLHEVVALYLGDPDYDAAEAQLATACATGDPVTIRAACAAVLEAHDSTRERLPLLESFYPRLFAVTGTPQTVLDLACGLNPLALPWMGLPAGARYYAYDIHQRRVDFLNRALALLGASGAAIFRDILVAPPQESGDVALLLKEIHRMEKRRRGIVLPLLDALDVRWIVLSSPTRSRTGRHAVKDVYREQVYSILAGRPWPVTEIEFTNELVYCIAKTP